ncbi:hypothetical protein B0T16DRAFT_403566 [Cercophora newfieldiana]|uniref:Uncharacterized protein n=1 Tax=Cercophora newfieldiana TaxID=92897 RepID=A0AA39YER4_9PEZI|nr:hypothetical protein B0T16DRAFT_403566 [Cercophora newfieldiana]
MTETTDDAAAARAAEQIRIRKERREAKIKAGAASRLDRITGLGGGIQRDPPPAPPATTTTETASPAQRTPAPASASVSQPAPRPQHADPDEVDISQHFYTPQSTQRIPPRPAADADAQLRQLMGLGGGLDAGGDPSPFGPGAGALDPGLDDDPMMRMMMQMLGGANPGGDGPSPFGFPPGAGAGGAGNPFLNMPGAPQAAAIPDRYASLWRLLHTAVALGLGLYIALWTSFTGTQTERERSKIAGGAGTEMGDSARKFFYGFATAEAVLLTTRYFMDRGRSVVGGGGSILGMVAGFLPQPFKGYVEMGLRYGQIFGTVKADVLVCIFVLGVCSWVRS